MKPISLVLLLCGDIFTAPEFDEERLILKIFKVKVKVLSSGVESVYLVYLEQLRGGQWSAGV